MSDKMAALVSTVKELIQEGAAKNPDCLRHLDNEIDIKENQIRELFAHNIFSVMQHFARYQETINAQRQIQASCEDFSKRVEKNQKLNAYDQQQIERAQKKLKELRVIRARIIEQRTRIKLAKKAALSMKEDKFNQAIKQLNEYKKTTHMQQQNRIKKQQEIMKANRETKTSQMNGHSKPINFMAENEQKKINKIAQSPMGGVVGVLQGRMREHIRGILDSFWSENKERMLEIGRQCVGKLTSSFKQKLNIHQLFFGKTLQRRSSLTKSVSYLRCTVVSNDSASRIMKQSDDNEEELTKIMVRVNVQMGGLKTARSMAVELDSRGLFGQMLALSLQQFLSGLEKQYVSETQVQFNEFLSHIVGFLLVRRQIIAFFDIKNQQRVFMGQVYQTVYKEIKGVVTAVKGVEVMVSLKHYFSLLHRVLKVLNIATHHEQYQHYLAELLKTYNLRNAQVFQQQSAKHIFSDNMTHFVTQDADQQDMLRQVLSLMSYQQFKFTSYVVFVVDYFMKTYEGVVKLLQGTQQSGRSANETGKPVYQAISELYQRVLRVYGGQLLGKNQHFEIIQGQVNLIFMHKAFLYFCGQLQQHEGAVCNPARQCEQHQQLIVQLTRNILLVIRQKLQRLMDDYSGLADETISNSHHQFVQWNLQFVFHIVSYMRQVDCPSWQQIPVETMRQMCELYWDYLNRLKEITLVVLHNLDQDLSFIYRFIKDKFGESSAAQKFRSLRQFYSLMLTNNIMDYLQPQKRSISYPNLPQEMLLPLLKKYNQVKIPEGTVRELRKKDVETLVKKLQQQNGK